MSDAVYLTREGFEKLNEQLEHLKFVERIQISKAIEEARLQGDLSENAEYDAAKEAQAHCEARIAELENVLGGVRIIENEKIPADKIFIGAIVNLKDLDKNKELEYMLVSPQEAELSDNRISVFSPIGKGLLTHKEGDEVEIEVPAGKIRYKVLKIRRP